MLTRVYVNNYRCLVNFELRLGRRQLIMGPNGSGKSSLLDALLFLRRVVKLGHDLERRRILTERTLWVDQPDQTFELEVSLGEGSYVYRLVVDSYGEPPRPRIVSEKVTLDGKPLFDFEDGKVHLFDDQFHRKVDYPFDWHRSPLATIIAGNDNRKLIRFKSWFENFLCFRISPFRMGGRAEREDAYPYFDLSNFASWYRHSVQAYPKENAALLDSLRAVLDGFNILKLESVGENIRSLTVEFTQGKGSIIKLPLQALSDGQRCLIGLYAVLHFVIAKGQTVTLDEPDNFIALREIQPWLNAVSDSIDANHGQVFIISHHPELMNQWAPDYGIQFMRDGVGQVRVKQFNGKAYNTLAPSEVVARGWENE